MKKFLLAISFVCAFAVVASAQTQKTEKRADAPTEQKLQPGDAGYQAPSSVAPAAVETTNTKAKTGTEKACSKAKACKKGKSCCKNKAEASKKEGKACCKKGTKACGKAKHDKVKKDEAKAKTTPVPAVKASEN